MLLSVSVAAVQAQISGFGINLKAYDPKAQFNENVDKTAFGISISYFKKIQDTRFTYGGEFGVAMYSSDEYDINFGGRNIAIEEEDCFFTLHGFLRYNMIQQKGFSLYSEARLGVTTFFSTTDAVRLNTGYEGEFKFHGTAFNMGAGIGILFSPAVIFSKDRQPSNFWLDLAINGHSGSRANYRMLPEGNGVHSIDDGKFNSLTHYFGYRIGFVFGI